MPGPHVYGDRLPAGRLSPSGPAGHLPLRGGWRNSAWGRETSGRCLLSLHRYRARPALAGLRAPRFPVGSVRENAGGHVGQQGELRKLGAGVGQPQTVGRQRTDLLCDGVKPA